MPKVYIAAAFRRFSNRGETDKAYGEILDYDYVSFLESIEEVFLNYGFDTCLPHRDEGQWGKVYYEPAAISALCLRHVFTSEVIFALAEDGRGVHIELGYAAGLGNKKLIMMYKQGTEPSTLIYGLPKNISPWKIDQGESADAVIEPYSDLSSLIKQLDEILAVDYTANNQRTNHARLNKALIDIGSHTIKLKIISHRPGSHPKILREAKQSLGIMGDVIKTGEFSKETIDNVVSLLRKWLGECKELSCESVLVTGTAALRKASNTNTLIERLGKETSLDLEILSPERELDYVYSGVLATFNAGTSLAVLNLGGGSTQLGVGKDLSPSEKYYFDFGTRELTERWPWTQPMHVSDYESMLSHVRERMRAVISNKSVSVNRMVHTGGELDFMLRCQLPLEVSGFSPVHVSEISVTAFSRFSQEFSRLHPQKVSTNFGLDPAWASGAVASNVIALCAAELVGAQAIIPSDFNISDGLLLRH